MARKKAFDVQAICRLFEAHLGGQEGEARVFWHALSFAVDAHSGQRRKSGEAYVSHPFEVVRIMLEELGVRDPETLAAAVLHDTVEDVPEVTQQVIGELFGDKIRSIVDGCTKIDHFTGDRKTFYEQVHRKIFSGAASQVAVILIKLADRLHNLRTMDSMPRHKRQKIAHETLAVYAPLAKVMGLYSMKRELYNLALTYKFPRQSQKVLARIRRLESSPEGAAIRENLMAAMEKAWLDCEVRVRARGLSAYYDQDRKKLTHSAALPVQIIVVVDDRQSCYRALGIVNQQYPPIPRTIRDFIANPKPTGYQSLHAKANVRGKIFLFKIRTRNMLQQARSGVIRHWLDRGEMPSGFEREIREMFDILGRHDSLAVPDMIAAREKKEIYTYTPKGECLCLPSGSLVLDFAFKVHTEVGRHCVAAMVGRKMVDQDYVLADGDQVKIICSEKAVRFDPRVQQACQSPRARAEIARLFRMRIDNLTHQAGRSLLRQELKRYGIPFDVMERDSFDDLLTYYGVADRDALYRRIGKGQLRLPEIIYEIKQGLWAGQPVLAPPTGELNRLELTSLDPISIKLSRCCNPIPVEPHLLGLLREQGLSVHRRDCQRLKELPVRREDVVELSWDLKHTMIEKGQTVIILKTTRQRLLMLLAAAPEAMRIHEIIALSKRAGERTDWEVQFSVEHLAGLRQILHHLDKSGMAYDFGLEQ